MNSAAMVLGSPFWKNDPEPHTLKVMEENEIIYKLKTATEKSIYLHLKECNNEFFPPLDEKVNINEYAKKIFEKAITFEAWDNNRLTGLIAAYFNNMESHSAFITNVSVTKKNMGLGIASRLLYNCMEYARQKGFKEIQLEVNKENAPAINFYRKFNFINCGSDSDTMNMKFEINK